jgi:hypothetical protein
MANTNYQNIKKHLFLLLLILVLLVPAIHKLNDAMPPSWFVNKFQHSFLASIPFGLSCSFFIIIFLELIGPLFLFIGWLQTLRKPSNNRFIQLGFLTCYVLFLILTFGSFLVQDYDNGFKDFMYFIGILLIDRYYFESEAV